MQRFKILFLTSSLGVGGAEKHILTLCRYLMASGHEPAVCTLAPSEQGLELQFLEEGISVFRLPLGSLRSLVSPRCLSSFHRILDATSPAVIHSHLYHADMAAAFLSFFYKAAFVTTRHSSGMEFGGVRAAFSRFSASRFDACVAVSEGAAAEAISNGFRREIVTVLPNAVDPDRFRPLNDRDRERKRRALVARLYGAEISDPLVLIGSASGLKPVKNLKLFLEVAARVAKMRESRRLPMQVRFVIFGEGDERDSLEELARELVIEHILAMPGYESNMEEVLPLLDIFVLASVKEGVPMALLEAMSCGVACVASAVGGVPGVLDGAGMLVDAPSEAGFAASLEHLIERSESRAELGRLARVRILERYSTDIWGDRMLDIYEKATMRKKVAIKI